MTLARDVYRFTALLPAGGRFGLSSQMRRAAVSLPSNVAEGFRRRHRAEFAQFLHIALGSAAELETQIDLCMTLHGLDRRPADALLASLDRFQAMGMSLIKRLQS